MKQTAVEWLANELLHLDNDFDMGLIDKNEYQKKRKEIIEKAKEMEKEQIKDAYHKVGYLHRQSPYEYFLEEIEEYYNETFKSE